jgi:hypothetical protein
LSNYKFAGWKYTGCSCADLAGLRWSYLHLWRLQLVQSHAVQMLLMSRAAAAAESS